jgi:hypothetical protein
VKRPVAAEIADVVAARARVEKAAELT